MKKANVQKKEQKQYMEESIQLHQTLKNDNAYQKLLKHKEDLENRQWDLEQTQYNQQALEKDLEKLNKRYQKFLKVVQQLSDTIKDEVTVRNLVVGAIVFLGSIFTLFTMGISTIVGGAVACVGKQVYDYNINKLRKDKKSYLDEMQQIGEMIREKSQELAKSYKEQSSLKNQISNIRKQQTKQFEKK